MRRFYLLILALAIAGLPSAAGAQMTIDDFESGTTAGWSVQDTPYTAISLVAPGAGGSANAIAVQEIAGSLGGHSAYAFRSWRDHRHRGALAIVTDRRASRLYIAITFAERHT